MESKQQLRLAYEDEAARKKDFEEQVNRWPPFSCGAECGAFHFASSCFHQLELLSKQLGESAAALDKKAAELAEK